jgi:hypothetical protein
MLHRNICFENQPREQKNEHSAQGRLLAGGPAERMPSVRGKAKDQ